MQSHARRLLSPHVGISLTRGFLLHPSPTACRGQAAPPRLLWAARCPVLIQTDRRINGDCVWVSLYVWLNTRAHCSPVQSGTGLGAQGPAMPHRRPGTFQGCTAVDLATAELRSLTVCNDCETLRCSWFVLPTAIKPFIRFPEVPTLNKRTSITFTCFCVIELCSWLSWSGIRCVYKLFYTKL